MSNDDGHDEGEGGGDLEARVRRLGGRTFELACKLFDGELGSDEAAREGRVLLDAGRALIPAVKALAATRPEDAARIQRQLRDAMLEAQFAVEGEAAPMRSERLAAYLARLN